MWLNLLVASGVLIVIVGIWFGVYYWLTPHVENPDAEGRVTGACGDTMEIQLKFSGNRVTKTAHWTDGCVYSLNCVSAAAALAMGKTTEEMLDIDADDIQKSIGGLPEDHMHCAYLALQTLEAAVDDCMKKSLNQNSV